MQEVIIRHALVFSVSWLLGYYLVPLVTRAAYRLQGIGYDQSLLYFVLLHSSIL